MGNTHLAHRVVQKASHRIVLPIGAVETSDYLGARAAAYVLDDRYKERAAPLVSLYITNKMAAGQHTRMPREVLPPF